MDYAVLFFFSPPRRVEGSAKLPFQQEGKKPAGSCKQRVNYVVFQGLNSLKELSIRSKNIFIYVYNKTSLATT